MAEVAATTSLIDNAAKQRIMINRIQSEINTTTPSNQDAGL